MKPQPKLTSIVILFFITAVSFAQQSKTATDYLHVSSISLLNKTYNLSWSSHPSVNYYKQEYLSPKENVEKYKQMLMVEVLVGDTKPADLVSAKVEELKKMKAANPMVNYNMFQKNGEYVLDFLLSDNAANGDINIIERNVYRYKSGKDKNGQQYVLLFAASERAYGKDAMPFLTNLKKDKSILVNAVAAFTVPTVSL